MKKLIVLIMCLMSVGCATQYTQVAKNGSFKRDFDKCTLEVKQQNYEGMNAFANKMNYLHDCMDAKGWETEDKYLDKVIQQAIQDKTWQSS